jgi:hypothetical protein
MDHQMTASKMTHTINLATLQTFRTHVPHASDHGFRQTHHYDRVFVGAPMRSRR